MKLARFWARDSGEAVGRDGERLRVTARGWSDESVEAAKAKAREVAGRAAQGILAGDRNQYQYDRPMPEPVIRTFQDAVVTRNSYGSLVLNTDHLAFIDIDQEDGRAVMNAIRGVVDRRGLAARVYKTAAGFRVLITNARFDGGTPDAEALLKEFGADPLYLRLCRTQGSFRARLSPKPWRCGSRKPPVSFPFETPEEERRFQHWEAEYNAAAARFATCHLITALGGGMIARVFEELVQYHDQETKVASQLPLA